MDLGQTFLTSIFFGLLATASPCVLPLYPGFLAYLSGTDGTKQGKNGYLLGGFVLLGVLSMMLILGGIIAILSVSIGRALAWFIPIADLMIIIFGLLLLININPFRNISQIKTPVLGIPLMSAYLYGFLYGPLTMPCSGPLVVGIFAYSFTMTEVVNKLAVFFGFGIGFGIPLFLLSAISAASQGWWVLFFAYHSKAINLAAGCLMLAIGFYDLTNNWPMIVSYLKM